MPRPFPVYPRGPRRPRPARPRRLLACPRVSPEWELGALRALMKPQTKSAILHRPPLQSWPASARDDVDAALQIVRERLNFEATLHTPHEGDFFFVVEVPDARIVEGRATALILSRRLPGTWLVLDRLFVRDGRFYRRERRFGFRLVPAVNVHLPREIRSALRDVL